MKYFICDPVSVIKKNATSSSKVKYKTAAMTSKTGGWWKNSPRKATSPRKAGQEKTWFFPRYPANLIIFELNSEG